MGRSFPRKAAAGGAAVGLALLSLTAIVLTKATPQESVLNQARDRTDLRAGAAGESPSTDRLVFRLKQLRKSGNNAEAALVFRDLFPPPDLEGSGAAASTPVTVFASQGGQTAPEPKSAALDPAIPVLATLDDEKHPSIDRRQEAGSSSEVYVAAELSRSTGPTAIAIAKSADRGATWPVSVALTDGDPRSKPSLRQVSRDDMGVIYTKTREGSGRGVCFARVRADFAWVEETPVDAGGGSSDGPSLASDFTAYALPYIYAAYSERTDRGYRVQVRVSPDLGRTWSSPVTAAEFFCPADIACDTAIAFDAADSSLTLAYVGWRSGSEGIAVTRSRSFGARWTPAVFVSDSAAGPCASPRVAAASGSAVVVYEQAISPLRKEIRAASFPAGGSGWDAGGTLAEGRSPDIRSGGARTAGMFYVAYVQDDSHIVLRASDATAPSSWSDALDIKSDETVVDTAPVALLPGGTDAAQTPIVAWTGGAPDFDVIILAPLTLAVTPADQSVPSPAGTTTFAVSKTGAGKLSWTAEIAAGADWLSIISGDIGNNVGTITAAFTANPSPSVRVGAITVTAAGAVGSPATVTVTQAGAPPGTLTVTPAGGLVSSGPMGGPFTPSSIIYTLGNVGITPLSWTASADQTWLTVSPASGTLDPGGTTTVTVAINNGANALAAGTYNGVVTFTNTTNGNGTTARPVALTVIPPQAALTVTPADGFSAAGTAGGPFTPSSKDYVLGNAGGTSIDWTAAKTQTWLTVLPASGTLVPGSTVTVTVLINGGANTLSTGLYSDVVTFTNATNGAGTTTRPVSLAVNLPPGTLSVSPGDGLASTGPSGGPFAPAGKNFLLENTGGTVLDWSASVSQAWTSISPAGGSLMPGGAVTVAVSINSNADILSAGSYGDTATFTNVTNGNGTTTRSVVLTVSQPPGVLVVSPLEGIVAYGPQGGPFVPSSLTYTLRNSGGAALTWSAAKTQDLVSLTSVGGTLAAGATTTMTVRFNSAADLLGPGTYNDLVTIINETNGNGTTNRPVALTVTPLPNLSVTPADRAVPSTPGEASFAVANTGGGTMNWTAAVNSGTWLVIRSGSVGTGHGVITVAFQANNAALPRQGIIRVTAPGAVGSPVDVTVTQAGGYAELTASGERLTERVWVVQREYAKLTVGIRNPTGVQIDKLAVSRKAAGESYRVTLISPWASSLDGQVVLYDIGLEPGKSYTLKVSALDALGNVICESNEVDL